MGMYVIDGSRGLWRADPDSEQDWNTIGVERPECACCGQRPTSRLPFDEIVVDPTDQELASLEPAELARFGMTRQLLVGQPD